MSEFKTSLDEYTKEEIKNNGNEAYGGKRHDEICEHLRNLFGFDDATINDISMGVWMGIESEKIKQQQKISLMRKMIDAFKHIVIELENPDPLSGYHVTDRKKEIKQLEKELEALG